MDSAPPTAATDQPADAGHVPQCARPGCSNPAPKGPTGRPKQYCSRSCRSKVDRAKAKAREAAAGTAAPPAAPGPAAAPLHAAPAAPGPAATPDGAAPAAPAAAVPVDDDLARWGEDGRHLLGLADAMRRKLTSFLLEIETGADPVAVFQELAARLPSYSTRAYMAAQEIRDKARWPDLTDSERLTRRMLERAARWGDDSVDPADKDGDGSASRGETAAADHDDQEQPGPAVPAALADVEPARQTPPALPRQQDVGPLRPPPEPYLRGLGRFDLIQNIGSLMGEPGWDLAGWTRAPGLFYVRKAGRALAWIEHGLSGADGWVVVIEGAFVAGPADRSRPLVTRTAELAALTVRQALVEGLIDGDTAPVLG
ncbi:hypothetical protein AB0F71_30970 [Kitasatospora sp. NPDC028055]|uniref:LptE family protein n=1 Tax=Kitasatospora sp. NPDC028055 TaxID=3155653 RepID=UPI0033F72F0C